MNKTVSTISGVSLATLIGLFTWFSDKTDSKIEKVETKTEVNREEIDQEENINIQQQMQIDRTLEFIERLDEKIK